jgi:hypothetical protein
MPEILPSIPYRYKIKINKTGLIFGNPFTLMYALKHYNGDDGALEQYRILNNPLQFQGRRKTDQSNEEINREIDEADKKKAADGTKSVETEIMQPFFICQHLNRKFKRTFSNNTGPSEKFDDCSIAILKTRSGYFLEMKKHTEIGSVTDMGAEIEKTIGGLTQGLKSCEVDIEFKIKNDIFCLDVVEFFSRYFDLSRIESDLGFRAFRKEDYFWLSRELFENKVAKVFLNYNNQVSITSNIRLLDVADLQFKNQYLVETSPMKSPAVSIDLLPDIANFPGMVLTDPAGVEILHGAARYIEDRFKRSY